MKLKPVDSISGITPKEFVKDYLKKGQPVIIKDFISKDSACWDKWSYDYFKEIAGQEQVDVYGREENSQNHAASPPVGKMTLAEYLDKISAEPTELRLFLFNLLKIRPELKKDVIYNDVTGGKVIQWLPYLFLVEKGRQQEITLILICHMCLFPSFKDLSGSGYFQMINLIYCTNYPIIFIV
ncbi:cupin-like domain-containing protein [Sphingobacterium sp. IITKGP-BTPF85]|uniref:cupin-like domain-containing protein n=1 Tax=Sphingobacterium sp. IITKGP-BTPF85 TaxID=1338009 RepID=UPI00040A09FE|nr:cupin-like domain-containing protein [Sphingobacterium sp. IITKGP-BTPF85]